MGVSLSAGIVCAGEGGWDRKISVVVRRAGKQVFDQVFKVFCRLKAQQRQLEAVLAAGLAVTAAAVAAQFGEDGNYLIGEVYSACGKKTEATAKYQSSAQASDTSELLWAWAAAKKLDDFDSAKWRERLLDAASRAESSVSGWGQYVAGTLKIAVGEKDRGEKLLREVFLLPNARLSHHLARLALAGATPR